MADSIASSMHATSDEYFDPQCDLCFEAKGLNVKVVGYCRDCFQFLCTDCHVFHGTVKAARGHMVLQGPDMPQSQSETPAILPVSTLQQPSVTTAAPQLQSARASSTATKPGRIRPSVPLSQIKISKQGRYNVKVHAIYHCWITGIVVTKDGRRILVHVDRNNQTVNMFSKDMKILSSLSLSDQPWDISVIDDQEAAVSMENNLVILDISGQQLCTKTKTPLSYQIDGICSYKDKFVVTCRHSSPPSVKLIDKTGRVYWSVSDDQHGERLINYYPPYVSSRGDGSSSTVIVTDEYHNTLILLNGDTGEVINRRQTMWECPTGVTTDTAGNVYVCYCETHQVAVMKGDLSEERILLTSFNGMSCRPQASSFNGMSCRPQASSFNGMSCRPQAIVYDATTHQLITSYHSDTVDCFQLS